MIGLKIKTAREARGLSQEYMAAMLEITQPSYSRIESDITRPGILKLKKISELLELDLLYLIESELNDVLI